MPVPDFQTIMLPLVNFCRDQREHTNRESLAFLAEKFNLTDEERNELLPSGQQAVFDNRVAWARAHLKMAKILENIQRGVFKITPRGMDLLNRNPEFINLKLLQQFPEYLEARNRRKLKNESPVEADQEQSQTPEEILEDAYQSIKNALANELVQQIKISSPRFFEKLVVELLVKMGYGGTRKDAGRAIGRSGDEGIDGIINEDRLGLDVIYIQAKRWANTIGRPDIQKFAGALQGQRARKGIFITTSNFSKEAEDYASRIENRIILIDGEYLAQLMIDHGVGVTSVAAYEIKRIDSDYFAEE
ncbi:MAG: restriction endonuclease [Gammaproteobacteria bacterium]